MKLNAKERRWRQTVSRPCPTCGARAGHPCWNLHLLYNAISLKRKTRPRPSRTMYRYYTHAKRSEK